MGLVRGWGRGAVGWATGGFSLFRRLLRTLFLELTPTSFIMSKYCVTIIRSSTWKAREVQREG